MTHATERVVQVKRDMAWHEAIAQHLPQVRTIPAGDPEEVIKWLFERVKVREDHSLIANALRDTEAEQWAAMRDTALKIWD